MTWLLEPGICRIKFGGRSVDVIDVEKHLERNSTVLAEANEMKHFVVRCAGAPVVRAGFQPSEGQTLSSHRDNCGSELQSAVLDQVSKFGSGQTFPGQADDLSSTVDGVGRLNLLELVPCPARDGIRHASDRPRAGVVRFDAGRFG